MNEIRILKPDDMHLHVRDGAIMANVIQDTARQFARAIIMPNLSDPIISAFKAEQYYRAIKATSTDLEPLMTLYFTDQLSMIELDKVKHSPHIHGVKLYPAGVTTNSESGIDSINDCFPIFEMMEKKGIPLLLHGEVNDPSVDIFDREKVFIDKYLTNICKQFPSLRIVFEHISTKEAVDFVSNSNQLVSATITPQHILLNRNDLLVGGIKPHNYCLPIVKRSSHQKAVLNALDKLENFASKFGADFYGLPQNKGFITLTKKEYKVPSSILIENQELIPFYAGETLKWQLSSN